MRRTTVAIVVLFAVFQATGCAIMERITGDDDELEPLEPNPVPAISAEISLKRAWTVGLGGNPVGLRPALSAGEVFMASAGGKVAGFDADSGDTRWREDVDISITGGVGTGEGLVLVGGLDGEVVALDQRDGAEVWRNNVDSEVLAPPMAGGGTVVVRTIDGQVTGLSSATGERRWNVRHEVPSLTLRGDSPPLIDQGIAVLGFSDGKLAGVRLDNGALMWEVSVARPSGTNEVERMIDVDASPLLVGNVLYVVTFQGNITAYALGANQTMWRRDVSSYNDIAVDDDNVYIADSSGRVHALDRSTGEEQWVQEQLLRRRLSGPAVLGDYVFVGDFEGYLHVMHRADGRFVGQRELSGRIEAQPLVAGNRILVMSNDGNLRAFSLEAGGN